MDHPTPEPEWRRKFRQAIEDAPLDGLQRRILLEIFDGYVEAGETT